MKIKDITESSVKSYIPPGAQETMPPTITVPSMDQYYEYYRFLIAVAGLPEKDNIPLNSPMKDGPYIAPFSSVEHDHSVEILKKMGKNIKHLTTKPSQELNTTNTVSPVRRFVDLDEK
jgi:hypothetical protein